MKTLGIGIVGARYGARMHLANYVKLPRDLVELRGVCSRTKESAVAFAQRSANRVRHRRLRHAAR